MKAVFEGLSETGEADDYPKAIEKLNEYFVPICNTDYEILVFRRARQEIGETIDAFHTRLRRLSSACDFQDVEREIKLQIIETCRSSELPSKVLLNQAWTLKRLLEAARMLDLVDKQTAELEHPKEFGNGNKESEQVLMAINHKMLSVKK